MLYRKPKEIQPEPVLNDFNEDIYDETFHCAIRPVLIIGQIFGLFPLYGISSKNPKNITFKWISLRTFYSFCALLCSMFALCLVFYQQYQLGPLTASNIIGIIFYGNCAFICLLFFCLSLKWRTIVLKWTQMEMIFLTDRYKMSKNTWSIKKRVKVCVSLLLFFAMIEHLLSVAVRLFEINHKNDFCNNTNSSIVDDYIQNHLSHIFTVIPYYTFIGLIFEYFNFSYTFYWSFIDLFIMICSIGIAYRFLQINERISFFRGRKKAWNTNEFCFFFRSRRFIIDKVYFWCSVLFLIGRTSSMFLFCSTISENSRKLIESLRAIPIKIHFPQRATKEDLMYNGTFHEATGTIFATVQLFGIMPVLNVKSKSVHDLKFTRMCFRYFLSIFYSLGMLFLTMLTIFWISKKRLEFGKMISLVFNASNYLSIVGFMSLAPRWPNVMSKWNQVDHYLPPLPHQMAKQKLAYQIKMIAFVVLFMSMIEHLLSINLGINSANNCPLIRDPIRAYFIQSFPQVFSIFDYSGELGMFVKFLNISATIVWSYTDLFVIIVSVGLASFFKRINEELLRNKGKAVYSDYWAEYRLYYREIALLVSYVDKNINYIVLISISNNLFFICVQLLNSLDQKPNFAVGLYFWFSLTYLIGRTLAVSLYAASINDESKVPLEVFRTVSKDDWCLEVKRFNEEVSNDTIALTGLRFFNLTRKLILSVAGTIVTYELVLIQFHQSDDITDYDPCQR
ncbi:unnamed protein product [Diamesa hyperborea]